MTPAKLLRKEREQAGYEFSHPIEEMLILSDSCHPADTDAPLWATEWHLTPPSNETTQAKPIPSCLKITNKTCQKISGENNNKKRKEDQNYSAL